MPEEPLEEMYFNWLCAKVLTDQSPTYTGLLRVLQMKEFVVIHPMDGNRAEDGIELRTYFLHEMGDIPYPQEWNGVACSLLEFFIAFCMRLSFQTEETVHTWFWRLMANLRLDEFRRLPESDIPTVEHILDTFVWRTYKATGEGGLFPLARPRQNQCTVEVWYQFCAWALENGAA